MTAIRVVLVDDHTLFRAGIRLLLEHLTGITVVGEASDGREAVRLVQQVQPHVVLMDIAMAGLNGLEATTYITREHPQVRVLILSMHASEQYVIQALRAGATGYLVKDAATTELQQAIRAVAKGETYLSHAVSKHVIADYRRHLNRGAHAEETESQLGASLTVRQREILQLIAEGQTTKQIAAQLYVSPKTVEAHRTRLMKQLDLHDVAGLVRYAIRLGLVTVEQ